MSDPGRKYKDFYRATLQSEAMSQKVRRSGSDLEIWGWAKGDEFKAQLMNMTRVLGIHSNGTRCMAWV